MWAKTNSKVSVPSVLPAVLDGPADKTLSIDEELIKYGWEEDVWYHGL